MAKNVTLGLSMFLVVLAMAPIVRSHSSNLITKEITLYGEMVLEGPNTNVIPVLPVNQSTFVLDISLRKGVSRDSPVLPVNQSTFVLDISLRKGVSRDSPPVGDVQGILVISSLDASQDRQVYISTTVDFKFGEYHGSTLEFQGTAGTADAMLGGELAIVGGTESVRFAGGYVSLRIIIPVAGTDNTVNEFKIFLKYDRN